jgi:hypothetical protein
LSRRSTTRVLVLLGKRSRSADDLVDERASFTDAG